MNVGVLPHSFYINLTNGLEPAVALVRQARDVGLPPLPFGVVRIQSTWLEQKRWSAVIKDLDYQFLFDLASGRKIIVMDASAKKPESRAIYQGLPWIQWFCHRVWFKESIPSSVKGNNVSVYWEGVYRGIGDTTKKKVQYVARLVEPKPPKLEGFCVRTQLDGDYYTWTALMEELCYEKR